MTKYKCAAEIANKALAHVASLCVPEARIYDICVAGDAFLEEQCAGVYAKSKPAVEKGIAFPTCISANECVCHCSPATGDGGGTLSEGDLVKIDLGCHIDGWIAVCLDGLFDCGVGNWRNQRRQSEIIRIHSESFPPRFSNRILENLRESC